MMLRRMYLKSKIYSWYFHPEITTYHEFLEFMAENPKINCEALDNATYFFDKLTKEEQISYWHQSYKLVMNHTRWVLDNLDNMIEYKVNWNRYAKKPQIGLPPNMDKIRANYTNIYK